MLAKEGAKTTKTDILTTHAMMPEASKTVKIGVLPVVAISFLLVLTISKKMITVTAASQMGTLQEQKQGVVTVLLMLVLVILSTLE